MGGTSVIVNVIFVPPRPSPAMFAWSDCTSVKFDGSTVVREPTMGRTTSMVWVTVPPLPSSTSTCWVSPVTFSTWYLTSRSPVSPMTSPGDTCSPSR